MEEIFSYLKSIGFEETKGESWHYACLNLNAGTIQYGFEYQLYDGEWKNPTTPAFYLWSGLGDSDSYGYSIPANDIATAKRVMLLLLGSDQPTSKYATE